MPAYPPAQSVLERPTSASPAGAGGEHEFAFSGADFDRVRELIYRRAGISLHDGKRAMVYSRLSRRLRETGHRDFASYLQALQSASGPAADHEWQEFVNSLTTNLTSFFREDHHFQALADDLRARRGPSIRIWCSAASTGEEPWSIAISVLETLGSNPPVKILATDIDTRVLATAERGVYADDARGLSRERLQRWFLRGKGSNAGRIRVRPELARLVQLRPFNLMGGSWSFPEPFDIVFCRNVMIYFDAATQRAVLERMHRVLDPGGLLYAGHSENFADSRDLFRLRGKTIYEKV